MKRVLCFAALIGVGIITSSAVAADPTLYMSAAGSQTLYSVDHLTATPTLIGSFGVGGEMAGLGYDPTSDTLYGTTLGTDMLYSINRSTGATTAIGSLGVTDMGALEYDVSTGKLYGAVGSPAGDGLYEINPATAQASLIGNIGFFHDDHNNTVSGLAVHPVTNVLYGIVSGPTTRWSALIEIDKNTGAGSLLGTNGSHISGLAFHPDTAILYGVDNNYATLNIVDAMSGATTLVSGMGVISNPMGLAFTPEPTTLGLLACGLGLLLRRRR
jgi:uncharacterized protein YjiK